LSSRVNQGIDAFHLRSLQTSRGADICGRIPSGPCMKCPRVPSSTGLDTVNKEHLRYDSAVLPLSPGQVREITFNRPRKCDAEHLHVWLLSAHMNAAERGIYQRVLSGDERARSDQYVFEIDRARSITARGGLRWLLSSYT